MYNNIMELDSHSKYVLDTHTSNSYNISQIICEDHFAIQTSIKLHSIL